MGAKLKTIKRAGSAALVEWKEDGRAQRAWVPVELAEDKEAAQMGIPYGIPWAEIIAPKAIFPEDLEAALRGRGIWTVEDAQANPQAIVGAIVELIGVDMAAVIRAARAYERERERAER